MPAASVPTPCWAVAQAVSSGKVRHQRCAAEWLAFSTTPLRLPCRGDLGAARMAHEPGSQIRCTWAIALPS